MNHVIFMGRLTNDPLVSYDNVGKPIVRFNFAVNRKFKREGEADADFFSCVIFGKIAENFEKCNVTKGTKLVITGEVRNNNYTNREGQKIYGTQIIVDSFEFCESKASGTEQAQAPVPERNGDGFMNIPDGIDEELPFN